MECELWSLQFPSEENRTHRGQVVSPRSPVTGRALAPAKVLATPAASLRLQQPLCLTTVYPFEDSFLCTYRFPITKEKSWCGQSSWTERSPKRAWFVPLHPPTRSLRPVCKRKWFSVLKTEKNTCSFWRTLPKASGNPTSVARNESRQERERELSQMPGTHGNPSRGPLEDWLVNPMQRTEGKTERHEGLDSRYERSQQLAFPHPDFNVSHGMRDSASSPNHLFSAHSSQPTPYSVLVSVNTGGEREHSRDGSNLPHSTENTIFPFRH